jgi:hypothetical protein
VTFTQHLSRARHSPLESDSLVKIHGNWCGPNWTGGRRLSAQEYEERGLDWNGPVISPLDSACRSHDYESRSGFTSKAADTRLIEAAEKRVLPWLKQLDLELQLLNPFLSSSKRKEINARVQESADAALISTGISIARATRRT